MLSEYLEMKDVVASGAPPDAFTSMASITNKFSSVTILPGDIITPARLLDKDAAPDLSFVIPKGKRAFTIQVNPVMGVAGFIQQGHVVDVIATIRPKMGGETITKIVLQDIQVLATGKTYFQELDAGVATPSSAIMSQFSELVTLAVTPEELERLTYIDTQGVQYRLVLKSFKDKDVKIPTTGVTEQSVLAGIKDESKPTTPGTLASVPTASPTPETPFSITPPTTPSVTDKASVQPPSEAARAAEPQADDGKVLVQYGSKRKEEIFKEGYDGSDLPLNPASQVKKNQMAKTPHPAPAVGGEEE